MFMAVASKTAESLMTKDVNANSLTWSKCKYCVDNNAQKFLELSLDSKTACIDKVPHKTIRHTQCSLFLKKTERCLASQKYRGTLHKQLSTK